MKRNHRRVPTRPSSKINVSAQIFRISAADRIEQIFDLLEAGALTIEPTERVTDCRDSADNKYLELALAANAQVIVASDEDLLVLDPWRGIRIMTPSGYVRWLEARAR